MPITKTEKPNDPDVYIPEDPSSKIWRYLDLAKFLYMLEKKQLFFTRADRFEDQFEGSWPILDKEKHTKYWRSFKIANPALSDEMIDKMIMEDELLNKNKKKDTFLNCWHVNDYESLAMWKVYGESNKSIAIQTTFAKLKIELNSKASLGLVEYIDYNRESIFSKKKYGACPYFFKRKSFEYENELRCISQRTRFGVQDPYFKYDDNEVGINIDIDLENLIESIFVSPYSEEWYFSLVQDIVRRYNVAFPVCKSDLTKDPIY